MWVGSYRIPIITLTGSLQQDLLFIEKVLGAGELALSDHRSSWPSKSELLQLISDARVGGMLSGKPGVIHFHMGSSPTKLDLLWQILNETTIPIRQIYPTHMSSRGEELIVETMKWLQAGGICDLTADIEHLYGTATVDAWNRFRREELLLKQITVSSDAYGLGTTGVYRKLRTSFLTLDRFLNTMHPVS
jgi:beta-aspartyl-dipeptidase (metallo-type)